ncbi:unnamed protein product [Jaminaea pallidilutea]
MSQDDLRSADEWSPGLHRRLLGVPFHLRPSKHDARGKGNEIEDAALLIKALPHSPSQTLAVVVVCLTSMAVLYEGLSFRTLHRRTKCHPPLTTQTQSQSGSVTSQNSTTDETVFDETANCALRALRPLDTATDGQQQWIEGELDRTEAALTFHLEQSSSSGSSSTRQQPTRISFSLDLSSLDRNEAPAFLRDHLLAPLAGLAIRGLRHDRPESSQGNGDRGDVMQTTVGAIFAGDSSLQSDLTNYTRRLHGLPELEDAIPAAPPVSTDLAAGTEGAPRARSRSRSMTRSVSPAPLARPPDISAQPPTPQPRSSERRASPPTTPPEPAHDGDGNYSKARHLRPQATKLPSGTAEDGVEEDDEAMIVIRSTPSSSASASGHRPRFKDMRTTLGTEDSTAASTTLAPTPSADVADANRPGTPTPAANAGGQREPQRELSSSLQAGPAPSSASAVSTAQPDGRPAGEEQGMEDTFQSIPSLPPTQRHQQKDNAKQSAADGATANDDPKWPEAATTTSSVNTNTSAALGPKDGKPGATSYRRGLAKRRRI